MTFDNVIPIDADVARQLARRQVRFRWLAAALFALWLAVLVPTLLLTPLPPAGPFIALAILVVLAEHRFVLFGDETSMSASILVIVASIFIFADTAPLAGPLLIASIAGLYLPHLRQKATSLVVANVAIFGLSAAISTALAVGLINSVTISRLPSAFAAAVAASVAYWYANSVLTGFASATRHETEIGPAVRAQATSEWPVLLLAIAVGLFGEAADRGTTTAVFGTAICMVCFEVYLRTVKDPIRSSAQLSSNSAALIVGISAVIWNTNAPNAAVAVLGLFAVVVGVRPFMGRTPTRILLFLIACSMAAILADLAAPVSARFLACTLTSVVVLRLVELRGPGNAATRPLPRSVTIGYTIPSLRELIATAALAMCLSVWLERNSQFATVTLLVLVIAYVATAAVRRGRESAARGRLPIGLRSSVGASR